MTTAIEQTEELSSKILQGATTAFIDAGVKSDAAFRPRFISNDYKHGRKMLAVLEENLAKCSSFDFSVAFVTRSGITPLLQTLRELQSVGVPGRVLTTDYLTFSDPDALAKLAEFDNIEVRLYSTQTLPDQHGFHTKGYLFTFADGAQKVVVGSSNMTGPALAVNKEWNLELVSAEQGEVVEEIRSEFEQLWSVAQPLADVLEAYKAIYLERKRITSAQPVIRFDQASLKPNHMQALFLSKLVKLIEAGNKRALLISATGTGKTFASAFAVRHIAPKRLLFLAHREQVLRQAKTSYERVLGSSRTYGLCSGNAREDDADYLFATMQTMSMDKNLAAFAPDSFDFIIVDEVHRAGSASYGKILDHFKPDFCLGMTASPDRLDGFDIYGLFDNNIAHEIRLQQALEENLLCPFHYFGLTELAVDGNDLDDLADFNMLVRDARVDHVVNQAEFYGHCGPRVMGLVFVSRNEEAQELSEKFNQRGYRTIALSGADNPQKREDAIARLTATEGDSLYDQRLDYIFTVDIFNEGVDIPEVNQVIMLRPTESPIVFVQQLGRGLRRRAGKDYVVILDFIGNYNNNYMIPIALSGDRSCNKDAIRKFVMEGGRVLPGASTVHFDEIAREKIFRSIDKSRMDGLRDLKQRYVMLKHKLARIPRMVDFQEHADIDPLVMVSKKKSYYRFLEYAEPLFDGVLSEKEHLVLEFVSRYVANGMRPHELLMLRELMKGSIVDRSGFATSLFEYFAIPFDEPSFSSAVRVLDKSFVNVQSERNSYSVFELVEFDGEQISRATDLTEMMKHQEFVEALGDVVSFGLQRFEEKYSCAEGGLTLYEKYGRKDVCRLLNWVRDDSATIYGYRTKHGTCPVFVTYNKKDDISSSTQYEDRFESPGVFSWMTRSRLSVDSPEVKEIINADKNGLSIHLFVKKSDGEGVDFYYMGKVHPVSFAQTTIFDDNGNELPIVNFRLALEHAVRDDVYGYFETDSAAIKSA